MSFLPQFNLLSISKMDLTISLRPFSSPEFSVSINILWYYVSLRSEKLISIFNFSFILTLSHLVFCQILHFFFLHHASPFCDFLSILLAALLVQDLNTLSWARNQLLSDAWLTSPPAHPVDCHQTDLITPIPRSLRSVSMAYWIKLKSLTGL